MKINLIFLFMLFAASSGAQTDTEVKQKMVDAEKYLNGKGKPLDPVKSLQLYKECAALGNAKAMNAVGMQYKLGLGVEQDWPQATVWFNKASKNGYSKAYVNLGLVYKYSATPDLKKAYDYFSKAADANELSGIYAKGYMLYKGLGCEQNYSLASQLFQKGAFKGKTACMYFLGLCLRNGYGMAKNVDSANYWLVKATNRGYLLAEDELATKEPENQGKPLEIAGYLEKANSKFSVRNASLKKFTKVKHDAISSKELDGVYEGKLIKYDWSGTQVLQSSKLALEIHSDNGRVSGRWVLDDSISLDIDAKLSNKGILFSNMDYTATDHYNYKVPDKKIIQNGSLSLVKAGDTVYLAGNIQMYSPSRKEPERPQYIILSKQLSPLSENNIKTNAVTIEKLSMSVHPNPFHDNFSISFTLNKASDVQALIFTVDGKQVFSSPILKLEKGKHNLPINAKLPKGTYVVSIKHDGKVESRKVIKQ